MSNTEWPKSYYFIFDKSDVLTFDGPDGVARCMWGIEWSYREVIGSYVNTWIEIPKPASDPSIHDPLEAYRTFHAEFVALMQTHDGQRLYRELFAAEKRLTEALKTNEVTHA